LAAGSPPREATVVSPESSEPQPEAISDAPASAQRTVAIRAVGLKVLIGSVRLPGRFEGVGELVGEPGPALLGDPKFGHPNKIRPIWSVLARRRGRGGGPEEAPRYKRTRWTAISHRIRCCAESRGSGSRRSRRGRFPLAVQTRDEVEYLPRIRTGPVGRERGARG